MADDTGLWRVEPTGEHEMATAHAEALRILTRCRKVATNVAAAISTCSFSR